MRLLSSISTRTLAGPNLSSLSLSLSLSLYLHYIRYTHSIFRIIIYRTYLLCCQIVQKTIKMLISEQPMSSNVICNGYDKAGFLSFVLYLLLCLEQLYQLVHKIPSILHLKPTFSILHHHFYKTLTSVYLFYKIFQ